MSETIDFAIDGHNGAFDWDLTRVNALMAITNDRIPLYDFSKSGIIDLYGESVYRDALDLIFERPLEFVVPKSGARQCFHMLTDVGARLHLVSSCSGYTEKTLWSLVSRHHLPFQEVIAGVKDKTDYYGACDVAVDDEVKHFEPLLEHEGVMKILMVRGKRIGDRTVAERPQGLDSRIHVGCEWLGPEGCFSGFANAA